MVLPALTLLSGAPLAFIDGLGGMEMLLVFGVALLLFGGDKLPEFARGIGKVMREVRKAASGVEDEFRRAMDEDERKRLAAAPPPGDPTVDPATGLPYPDSSMPSAPPAESAPAAAGPDAPATDAPAAEAAAPNPAPEPPKPAAKPPPAPEDYP